MNIVFVSPEMEPLVKVGGLADVVSALSLDLARRGENISVILPSYSCIDKKKLDLQNTGVKIGVRLHDVWREGTVWEHVHHGIAVYLLEKAEFFDREGIYGIRGSDYDDNAFRFAFLARAALETAKALKLEPDVFHIHDWQTALLPVYQKLFYQDDPGVGHAGVVLSIHNLAYQGLFASDYVPRLGLPTSVFHIDGLEFHGQLSFLKGGLVYSDLLTTVSPTYAKEIQTTDYGAGLDGLLRHRSDELTGILNGIDPSVWNPGTDTHLYENYSVRKLTGKATNKRRLQESLGLSVSAGAPLLGCIARLDPQKGFDLVLEVTPRLLAEGAQIVLLGSGRQEYLDAFQELADRYPHRLSLNEGFQPELASKIYAGADLFLMPSRYEPCGLGQMIALRYGAIPVVRHTGGLADSIVDVDEDAEQGNGFVFNTYEAPALLGAIRRALKQFKQSKSWRDLVLRAMKQDFSWKASASHYKEVYTRAAEKAARRTPADPT